MTGSVQTLKQSNADFAVLSCAGADYLINREEVLHSRYLGSHEASTYSERSVAVMNFDERLIPVINLDVHIRSCFGDVPAGGPDVVLIISGAGYNPPFPVIRRRSDSCDVDTSIIALRTSVIVSMLNLQIHELKPLPLCVRDTLARTGILAVRFLNAASRPQYLIDMRTTAILCITAYHNRQVQNGHSHS